MTFFESRQPMWVIFIGMFNDRLKIKKLKYFVYLFE